MALNLNPFHYSICFTSPRRLTPFSAWHEHIPFAMFLVDILKPNMIVELGTYYGDSYCAFCQAVHELHLSTLCYAIDTWKGDPHSGFYGPDVLADLRAHHDRFYGSFSRLIQSTFDEALQHFRDGTIDLLHIDGYHSYETVKHDFVSWLPKMSRQGIILLHDINVREGDFGIWKLWDELKSQYPHFHFLHGHGLGMLAVGKDYPKVFQELLDTSEEDFIKIRNFFFEFGHKLTLQMQQTQPYARLLIAGLEQSTQTVQAQQQAQERKEQQVTLLMATVQAQQQAQEEKEQQVTRLIATVQAQQQRLDMIHASLGWRLLNRYWQLKKKLLTLGTRKVHDLTLGSIDED